MKESIRKAPVPLCGVALGMAALGNLLQSYSQGLRYSCGAVSGLLLILFLLKAVMFPQMIRQDMKNPVIASVAPAFPMALTQLSVYLQPWLGRGSYYLWLSALALHAVLTVYFTWRFIFKLEMTQVFASYFVVYVGVAVGAVTAPAYGKEALGAKLVWFALAALAALLVLVTLRYLRFPCVEEAAQPLICIYTAPTSLCIVGYVQSVSQKSQTLLLALLGLSTGLYLFALFQAAKCLKLPFYPSFASFTFPFVITAIAARQAMDCLAAIGAPQPWLRPLALAETAVACFLTLSTLVRFLWFIFGKERETAPKKGGR